MNQTFSDGLAGVSIVGNTVRLDFMTLSPTEKDAKGQPRPVFSQRIVMDMDAFLRTAGKVQESVQTLSKLAQNARNKAAEQAPTRAEAKPTAEKPAEKPADKKAADPKAPPKRPFP